MTLTTACTRPTEISVAEMSAARAKINLIEEAGMVLQVEAEETASERVMRSWLLALLLIGEVISLSVVAGGIEPSKSAGSYVGAAVLGAGFMLVVPVLGSELKEERTRSERLGHALAGRPYGLSLDLAGSTPAAR